jgi:SAM-dependent methyltransferase
MAADIRAEHFDSQYFERVYRNYARQNPTRKIEWYRQYAERFLPAKGGAVLEIGCAFGLFLDALGPSRRRVGMDISAYAISRARQRAPGASFFVGSAENIPLRGSFDLITAFDVVEHVPNLDAVADFVDASLRADGVFLIVVPVYDGPLGWLVRLLDRDPTHVHKRSRQFWTGWIQRRFELIHYTGVFRWLTSGGYYIHWPVPALTSISPAILICARRKRNSLAAR